jgi:ADP-ribosylation factor family
MLNEDEIQYALLLVFANKQDFKMMVMNIIEITDMLGLRQINPYSSFKIEDHFYSVWTLEHPDHHLM